MQTKLCLESSHRPSPFCECNQEVGGGCSETWSWSLRIMRSGREKMTGTRNLGNISTRWDVGIAISVNVRLPQALCQSLFLKSNCYILLECQLAAAKEQQESLQYWQIATRYCIQSLYGNVHREAIACWVLLMQIGRWRHSVRHMKLTGIVEIEHVINFRTWYHSMLAVVFHVGPNFLMLSATV